MEWMIPLSIIFPVYPWGTARGNLVKTESKSGLWYPEKKKNNKATNLNIIEL